MDDIADEDGRGERVEAAAQHRTVRPGGRLPISPLLTYLLIGGAALGLIALMCLVVALVAVLRNS